MINILTLAALWCANITVVTVPAKSIKQCRKEAVECLVNADTDDKKLACAKSSNTYE